MGTHPDGDGDEEQGEGENDNVGRGDDQEGHDSQLERDDGNNTTTRDSGGSG